jgi:hypothetical protein
MARVEPVPRATPIDDFLRAASAAEPLDPRTERLLHTFEPATQGRIAAIRATDPHGTRSEYMRGCRCVPCRDANRAYQREWRARWRPSA